MKERLKQIYRAIFGREDFQYTSYSQAGEDRIINLIRKQLKLEEFRYVDIGACSGVHLSNTCLFYRMGFRGVLVEANPLLLDRIAQARPEDKLIHAGVVPSQMTGSSPMNFHVMSSNAMGTFSEKQVSELKQKGYTVEQIIPVPVITLDGLFAQHASEPVHLLSLDVEGLDESILEDFDFEKHRPVIICVETMNSTGKKNDAIPHRLKVGGYYQVADTVVNSIFVREGDWQSSS
jgi:FkbM family methyltransferase